jgi:micrococcal nuclease
MSTLASRACLISQSKGRCTFMDGVRVRPRPTLLDTSPQRPAPRSAPSRQRSPPTDCGTVARIRLISIDTPETVKPNTPVECFGRAALAYARCSMVRRCPSKSIPARIRATGTVACWPTSGWTMAGWSTWSSSPAATPTNTPTINPIWYQQQFKQAQQDAQAALRGLWSPATCNGVQAPAGAATTAPAAGHGAPALVSCASKPDPASAPNTPIVIVAVDKRAELVQLKNVGSAPIDLAGWTMCSLRGAQRHPVAGVIAPGEMKDFPGGGQSIWSNGSRDDGALFDAQGCWSAIGGWVIEGGCASADAARPFISCLRAIQVCRRCMPRRWR